MNLIENIKPWTGRKAIRGAALLVGIAVGAYLVNSFGSPDEVVNSTTAPTIIKLTTANEFAGTQSLSVIGNVRAFTEADVTSEVSGQVVSVPVTLGQYIQAGQVIATLENAPQRAAVTQAEGVYDAAVAAYNAAVVAASQSTVGVDNQQNNVTNAQNAAVATFRSAYNTVNGVVINSIDPFFSAPDSSLPGLRLDGRGYTTTLNNERIAYQTILPTWQTRSNSITTTADLETELAYARAQTERTLTLVDTFIAVFNQQSGAGRYTEAELQGFSTSFTGLRANLNAVLSSIDAAAIGLRTAADGVKQAELTASIDTTAAANAQIKQALGSLRAAQANLAKTILRSPISGTVNALNVRTGDFIGAFTSVAQVANNNALEIVTYVGDTERSQLAVGDVVYIEGQYEGRVAQIAPIVDSATKKTEVRIATENPAIQNGDTVTIEKEFSTQNANTTILIPLTAVKFEITDGYVFLVNEGKLVQTPVTLGVIRGGSVEIISGLAATDAFVVDARGLLPGMEVTIAE